VGGWVGGRAGGRRLWVTNAVLKNRWDLSSHYCLLIWKVLRDSNDCLHLMRVKYCSCSYVSINCDFSVKLRI
jgi:hypothetical protein